MAPGRILTSRHGLLILAAGGLLILAISVAVLAARSVRDAIGWVSRTYHVMGEVNRCAALVRFAETEQRGYLLFGRPEYVAAFAAAEEELRQRLGILGPLLTPDPAQRARFDEFAELVEARMEEMHRLAEVRRTTGSAQRAIELFNAESSLALARGIRERAESIVREETRMLDERRRMLDSQLSSAALIATGAGLVALFMGVYTFVMMRRALLALDREADLLRQKEHAERADRDKSEFLANMSHEIRTPMNAVLGFADLLRAGVTDPRQRNHVEAIRTSGRALLSIINDILDLSKIEAGRLEIRLAPMSVRAVFDDVRTIFSKQAKDRGVALEFAVGDDVPGGLLFDAPRLRQILFNLVGNAVKFTSHGSISVRAEAELRRDDETRADLRIAVADTGIGIAAEHHDAVFEPFRQVGAGIDREFGGTGLGLSISRRLAHALGGTVGLRSELGAGSTFTLDFPRVAICPPPVEERERVRPEEDLNAIRPSTVLLADDVPLNRQLIEEYFAGSHHRLVQASDGREAVRRTLEEHPDIVLMDVRMPDMTGVEALVEIRKHPEFARLPIVAVTASSMLVEENRLKELFDGYIRKPFTRRALFREMARLLAKDDGAGAPATAAPRTGIEATGSSVAGAGWGALASELRGIEAGAYAALVDAPGFRESEVFARRLAESGEAAACEPVAEFARRLLADTDAFDTDALEATLRGFPGLVARVERAAGGVS